MDKIEASYKAAFNTPAGEAVLKDLAQFCKMFDTTYAPGDPYTTVGNEFKRRVFLHILGNLGRDAVSGDLDKKIKALGKINNLKVNIYE